MHLAILMTNTDESDFAQAHPKDGEKFTALIHSVRPNWSTEVFSVKDGIFPDKAARFDGLIITGSPASVRGGDAWIDRLLDLIRGAAARGQPMFGACFGHQAIALALGGEIGDNPHGWSMGLIRTEVVETPPWAGSLGRWFNQHGGHTEQVTKLPPGARVLTRADGCRVAGYAIGKTVYTTQNHPEITDEFSAALIAEYTPMVPAEVGDRARASLAGSADIAAYAGTIAGFFETAQIAPHD